MRLVHSGNVIIKFCWQVSFIRNIINQKKVLYKSELIIVRKTFNFKYKHLNYDHPPFPRLSEFLTNSQEIQ